MYVKVAKPYLGKAEIDAVTEVLQGESYVSGARVREFERKFADYIGVKHAVAVNSGTAALHAALFALDLRPGDEVIVPALTFFSTVTAVIHQGCVPIFCDIDRITHGMCPKDLQKRITHRTKAVLPVHYLGYPVDIVQICEIAKENSLAVVEDCAQAHGSKVDGKVVGSFGELGAFSFFATKHITTGGEGGAITTNDDGFAKKMRLFRSHGLSGRNDHILLGYNYRMPEICGAIGAIQMEKIDSLNQARISVSNKLIDRIKHIQWLTVPQVRKNIVHTYFWCHIDVNEELLGFSTSTLINKLKERGVESRNRYIEPLYKQPLLAKNIPTILKISAGENLPDYKSTHLPVVESLAGKFIGLPNRPDMSEKEIEYVVHVLETIKNSEE